MKASVVKITEEAKLRDTVRRNIINVAESGDLGTFLYEYQITVSQVAGTKRHFIILEDEDGSMYMLDFNIGKIEGLADETLAIAKSIVNAPSDINEAEVSLND